MNKQESKKNNIVIVAAVVISLCVGYTLGYFGKAENNEVPEVYQLPDSIDVTGVSFELESGILTCEFVPAVYSDKLNYNVTALTSGYKGRKTDAAILENGVGEVKLPVKDAMFYKVVLEITNGVESRNVTLADKLYVDNKNNIVTEH